MRLVTWNVNSLRERMPRLFELLRQHRPDVALLQETKVEPEKFPHGELARAGYRAIDHSGGPGVAILARDEHDLSDPVRGLEGEPDDREARWVEATLDRRMRVASLFVPNGGAVGTRSFDDKLAFLDAVAARVGALARTSLIVAGDMNVAPADIDVYDPAAFAGATHVTSDERERLQRVLDAGLIDAYRHLHPEEAGYTWWDHRAGHFTRDLGLRIDLVLVSLDVAPRVTACRIDRNYRKGMKPSDHAPLLVELGDQRADPA